MWPGFKSWWWCRMWVEFVVGHLLCSERFFSGYSGFPLSSKINISKFQYLIRNQVDEEELCGCATSKSLFIYLFIYKRECYFWVMWCVTGSGLCSFGFSRNKKIDPKNVWIFAPSLCYNNMLPSVLFLSYAEKNVHGAPSPLFVHKTERSCINACTRVCLVYIIK